MKILVGYDGSRCAKAALDVAIFHAKSFKASILLVYSIIERIELDFVDADEAGTELEFQKKRVLDEGIECEAHLLIRDLMPGEDIVRFGQENNVAEIIVGVKKRSRLEKIFFGSTARYVILNAHCPVVTVK